MANQSNEVKRNTAEALLALGLAEQTTVSETDKPSDEELALLLEGSLEPTRKSQVLKALAYDSQSFNRWASLVEMNEILGFEQAEASIVEQPKEEKTGFISRVVDFLQEQFMGVSFAGMASVAAVILMLNYSGGNGIASGVDDLYSDYGNDWVEAPVPRMIVRGAESVGEVPQNLVPVDQALLEGLSEGLEKLGPNFFIQSVEAKHYKSATRNQLESEQFEMLKAAGNFAALSYFKCMLGGTEQYFAAASDKMETLAAGLSAYTDEATSSLVGVIKRSGDAEARVCQFSQQVIERVSK